MSHSNYNRKDYIKKCGHRFQYPNPVNGKEWITTYRTCGFWRECDNCYGLRVSEYESLFEQAKKDFEQLYVLKATESEERKIKRTVGGDQYIRFPHIDSVVYFVLPKDALDEDSEFFWRLNPLFGELFEDWVYDLINTAPNKRISGSLLDPYKEQEEEDEDAELVRVLTYRTNAPEDVERDARVEAIAKTAEWEPQGITELQTAIKRLQEIYHNALQRRNNGPQKFEIEELVINRKINPNDIDWGITSMYKKGNGYIIDAISALEQGAYSPEPFFRDEIDEAVYFLEQMDRKTVPT